MPVYIVIMHISDKNYFKFVSFMLTRHVMSLTIIGIGLYEFLSPRKLGF